MSRRSPKPSKRPVKKAASRKSQGEQARGVKRYYASQKPPAVTAPKPMTISSLIDRMPPEPDRYVRALTLPKLPADMQCGAEMAFDDAGGMGPFPNQGFLGAFSLYFPGYPYLAMLTQRSEFRQPTETHAKDMTREWIEFKSNGKGDKASRIKELEDAFTKHKVQEVFRRALVHDGFYGVGHIFIDLRDHEDASLPVQLDGKSISQGSLRGFHNIDPMWVTPVMWQANDPTAPDFYVPEIWNAMSRRTHKTRLLQVISREVPDIIKPAYNFGGISMSQLIEPYVDRWLKTVSSVNKLISNFSLIYLKTDMSAVLSGLGDENIRKRMKLARQYGDNMGMFMLDMAKEELGQVQVGLAGLSELQAQAQEHQAAPTHLPLVVLTGVTPSGLNASSDGEIEVYHDWNRSEQNAVIRPDLMHMMHVTMLDLWGEIDEDISFEFVPIKQVTGEALARIKKTESEQNVAYIDAGVVDRLEVREKVARDPDSGFVNLDVEKLPEMPGGEEGAPDDGDPSEEDDDSDVEGFTLDHALDANWEEGKHKRAEGGKFGAGGSGGGGGKAEKAPHEREFSSSSGGTHQGVSPMVSALVQNGAFTIKGLKDKISTVPTDKLHTALKVIDAFTDRSASTKLVFETVVSELKTRFESGKAADEDIDEGTREAA